MERCFSIFILGINIGKDGRTPLDYASTSGPLDVVSLLIEKGADINRKDIYRQTLLLSALSRGKQKVAALLIEKGADINAKDKGGRTPLHYASAFSPLDVVSLLIEKGADVNARDSHYGQTPLHLAIEGRSPEVASFLIEKGADVNSKDLYGEPPFSGLYIAHRYIYNDPRSTYSDLRSSHYKARWGKIEFKLASLLIKSGFNPNTTSQSGRTPFERILFDKRRRLEERQEIASFLLDNGVDINTGKGIDETYLHKALFRDRIKIAPFLIEKRIDLNSKNRIGTTAFAMALNSMAKMDFAKLLIEKGADVKSYVPRMLSSGNTTLFSLMIERGGDINGKDEDGRSYLQIALNYENWKAASFLIKKGVDINVIKDKSGQTLLNAALEKLQWDAASFLIRNGADVNAKDDDATPLHYIVYSSCPNPNLLQTCTDREEIEIWKKKLEIIDQLISAGADINSKDKDGDTLLYGALRRGKAEMAYLLIRKGAVINAKLDYRLENKNYAQRYILHRAIENGHYDLTRLLINNGVNVNTKNETKTTVETPLSIALNGGKMKLARLLIKKGRILMLS